MQPPQSRVPPQLSAMMPHDAPAFAQVSGAHPQWPNTPPPPHVWGGGHPPQFNTFPQPSPMNPQFRFCAAHVVGTQPTPQTPGVPPPQTSGGMHFPQLMTLPQPSD
jgi:hypothetical protein